MNKSSEFTKDFFSIKEYSDEVNLMFLFNLLSRNKVFIGCFALIFFVFSYIFASNKKKIWEGQFEIVVENSSQGVERSLMLNQNLQNLIGFNSAGTSLSTEIGILESPLVLMPIFEFVNDANKKNDSKFEDLNFSNWKEDNLSIELKKGTSILQVSYKDKNKNIIVPVLTEITDAYQQYSGRNKKRSFQLAKNFLNDQIKKYKIKSSESLKIAQEYAMDQDLTIVDLDTVPNFDSENKNSQLPEFNNIVSNIGIESKRVSAANEIRNIDLQIEKILKLDDDFKKIQYIGSTIAGLKEEGLPKILEDIERELIELRLKYTDKDNSIFLLKQKREFLIKLLKERAVGYLKAQRIVAEAKMESAIRPKGVVLNYKSLMREAGRDENTLIQLENQLRKVMLEEARIEEPWELITKPTLKRFPIAPRKFRFSLIGMLLGLLLGYILSFYKERKKGYIYEEEYLENILDTKIFNKINLTDSQLDKKVIINLFEEIIEISSRCKLRVLITKNFDSDLLSEIKNLLPEKKYNLKYAYDLNSFVEEEEILLLTTMNCLTISEINNIRNRLSIINKKILAILLTF